MNNPEYAKGYQAGRKAHRRDRKHEVFCAALTGLLAGSKKWSRGTREFSTTADYVELASEFAEKWEAKHA